MHLGACDHISQNKRSYANELFLCWFSFNPLLATLFSLLYCKWCLPCWDPSDFCWGALCRMDSIMNNHYIVLYPTGTCNDKKTRRHCFNCLKWKEQAKIIINIGDTPSANSIWHRDFPPFAAHFIFCLIFSPPSPIFFFNVPYFCTSLFLLCMLKYIQEKWQGKQFFRISFT